MPLSTGQAIPIGLIVNELVMNAVKYAFTGETGGTVMVTLDRWPGGLRLTVADDGSGIDPRRGDSGLGARPRRGGEQCTRETGSSAVEANNTTVAADGSPATLLADSFNVQAGWRYLPVPEERIVLEKSQRLVVRISAPADELTLNGSLVFEEIGTLSST